MSSRRATVNASAGRYAPYHAYRSPNLLSRSSGSCQSRSNATLSALAVPSQALRDLSSRRPTATTQPSHVSHPSRSSPSSRSSSSSRPSRSSPSSRPSQPSRPSQRSSLSASTAALSALGLATAEPGQHMRDVCHQIIGFKYPGFRPRNDFEIITLATRPYPGARSELGTWLDHELAFAIQDAGSLEVVMDSARSTLALPASRITGLKPGSTGSTERGVFLRPIPNSPYSIRLFPGCALAREYCLDFVETRTGVPVNSPFKFELWGVPNSSAGPSFGVGATPITNLESAFSVRQDEILPGHEKFLLTDGQTCLLRRPGHKDVRFTVPIRRQPAAVPTRAADDVDVLDLPASY